MADQRYRRRLRRAGPVLVQVVVMVVILAIYLVVVSRGRILQEWLR